MKTSGTSGRSVVFRVCLLLGFASACTRLFGDRENTLAPLEQGRLPNAGVPDPLLPEEMAAVVCSPGESRCDGALLQACANDGGSWLTLERCPGAALCQPSPPQCLDATCGPEEMSCDGAVLLLCNQERTGWQVFDTCASAAHCNADERQCTDGPCTPGDRRCNRNASQIPVIDRCRDDQSDWDTLSECSTRELCEQTLTGSGGGLELSSDGTLGVAAPIDESTVVTCNAAACTGGEVRCNGAQLESCNPGRTGWALAEQCGSPALCESSLTSNDAAGNPRCLVATCTPGAHQCTEVGALQVCNEERTGFRTISTCIGPAFCNSVLADQGGNGCTSAPCEAGAMQCNGAQVQRCLDDRTGFENVGVACETAALCNDDDPLNAFCAEPACRRGELSAEEFECQAASLQRCNEEFTGYAEIGTCATPALCDASRRFEGCAPPVCAPGQHTCNGTFLARCNEDRTGFEDVENCGSAGQCDANAGSCADPCEPGSVRCNTQTGDLEECQDRLTGWQVSGDCLTLQLCDAGNRRCNPPVCTPGQRRCSTAGQAPIVEQCAPGRDRFETVRTCGAGQLCDAQNLECDNCQANSVSCQGDTLLTCDARGQNQTRQTCGRGLCDAGQRRCRACGPLGSARCADRQLFVCAQGQQAEFERSEFCETDELCDQTLGNCGSGQGGQNCQCNAGSCRPNQLQCSNGNLQRCNEGLTAFASTGVTCNPARLCNAQTGDCDACVPNEFSCGANNNLRQCSGDGRSFARQNLGAVCEGNNLVRCVNGQVQRDTCGNGLCNAAASRCNQCQGNGFLRCDGGTAVSCGGGLETRSNCNNLGCNAQRGCNQCNFSGSRCTGNTLETCNNGVLQTQACNSGCNGQRAQCNQCIVGTTLCLNQNQEQSCPDGLTTTVNCTDGCVSGQCADCREDECANGNQSRRDCNNGQLGPQVNCGAGEVCQGAGQCTFRCTPNQARCNGQTPQRCNGAGTAFDNIAACNGTAAAICQNGSVVTDTCTAGEACQGGRCVFSCTPNQTRCNGQTPQRCNGAGTAFDNIAACNGTAAAICQNGSVVTDTCTGGESCQGGRCLFCTPNQTRCDGQTPQRCNGAGTAFDRILACNGTAAAICQNGTLVTDTCAADETCQGGQCLFTCNPNETRCIGTTPQRCDGAGAAFDTLPACSGNVAALCQNGSVVTDTCLGGEVCQAGRCVFRCTPNSFISCTGSTLTTCNAAGTAPVSSPCNLGQSCGAGTSGCVGGIAIGGNPDGQLCVPNSVVCDGTAAVFTCAPDGLSRNRRPCAAGQSCVNQFTGAVCSNFVIVRP